MDISLFIKLKETTLIKKNLVNVENFTGQGAKIPKGCCKKMKFERFLSYKVKRNALH